MKNIRVFISENFQFLEVKFLVYLNKRVFAMKYFSYFSKKTWFDISCKLLHEMSSSVFF